MLVEIDENVWANPEDVSGVEYEDLGSVPGFRPVGRVIVRHRDGRVKRLDERVKIERVVAAINETCYVEDYDLPDGGSYKICSRHGASGISCNQSEGKRRRNV